MLPLAILMLNYQLATLVIRNMFSGHSFLLSNQSSDPPLK